MDRVGDRISAVIVSDSPGGKVRWSQVAVSAGMRIQATGSTSQVLSERGGGDIALIDVEEDSGEALDDLLDALEKGAGDGRFRALIAVTPQLVDPVVARIVHSEIELLCVPSEIERAAALGFHAAACRKKRVNQPGRKEEGSRLLQLSEEVARIARSLAEFSRDAPARSNGALGDTPFAVRAEPVRADDLSPEAVRSVLRARRARGRFFDEALFADPAWDMLLDLMEARLRGREVAVSSLCIAAAVPPTTALRWIRTLTERGLFVRRADPDDGRRIFIELSDEAANAMHGWFAAAMQGEGLPLA